PPTGFVVISSPDGVYEGNDSSFDSFRYTNHSIWFTSVLPGGSEANLYTASTSGQAVSSEAAEVAYFLGPQVGSTAGASQPLFNLYRRQRLVATNTTKQTLFNTLVGDPEMISVNSATPTQANTMSTIVQGGRSNILAPLSNSISNRVGDDIILSNV